MLSPLNPFWELSVPKSFFLLFCFSLFLSPCSTFSSLPHGDLLPQCGFFKRSEPRRPNEAEFYRAHLGVQPSEVEKQASEL